MPALFTESQATARVILPFPKDIPKQRHAVQRPSVTPLKGIVALEYGKLC